VNRQICFAVASFGAVVASLCGGEAGAWIFAAVGWLIAAAVQGRIDRMTWTRRCLWKGGCK
jgi:hypothetical protein